MQLFQLFDLEPKLFEDYGAAPSRMDIDGFEHVEVSHHVLEVVDLLRAYRVNVQVDIFTLDYLEDQFLVLQLVSRIQTVVAVLLVQKLLYQAQDLISIEGTSVCFYHLSARKLIQNYINRL